MSWMAGLYRTPPLYCESGVGAVFRDIDGNEYVDFNLSDLSMTAGFGPPALVEAVSAQLAGGAHFLLPTPEAIDVSERLAERMGLPYWQATLSASGSITEVIRIARAMTGREQVVLFGGYYHGHLDEMLADGKEAAAGARVAGLTQRAGEMTHVLPFNDLAALETALEGGQVAVVITEPALTNCNVVLPKEGFLQGVRALTARHGTLLCIDEAHTFQFAYGGLTREWQLATDFIVLGKGLGTGIPFGFYGMSALLGEQFGRHLDVDIGPRGIATGGTVYGNAMTFAAARVALQDLWRPEDHQRINGLGRRLAHGLDRLFARHELPWRAFRLGPRSGYCLEPSLPSNGDEALQSLDDAFIDTRRVYMANRGIWDAVASAGPQASLAHTEAHMDHYLRVADEFLSEVVTESTR